MPANLGKTCAIGCPASWREVSATSSACGCRTNKRTNSSPEYPLAPTTAIFRDAEIICDGTAYTLSTYGKYEIPVT
jgi:hypothetical protein